jgi:hypothetical protein
MLGVYLATMAKESELLDCKQHTNGSSGFWKQEIGNLKWVEQLNKKTFQKLVRIKGSKISVCPHILW